MRRCVVVVVVSWCHPCSDTLMFALTLSLLTCADALILSPSLCWSLSLGDVRLRLTEQGLTVTESREIIEELKADNLRMIVVLEQKDLELHELAAEIHHKEVKIEEQGTKLHEVNDIENNMKILKVFIRFTQLDVLLVEHYYFGSLILYANVAHTSVVL